MNVIVTGASQGIGKEIVKGFDKKGYSVIAIARNKTLLKQLEEECKNVTAIPFDLKELDKVSSLLTVIEERCSSVDILINNAGALFRSSFEDALDAQVKEMFDVNLFAPALLIKTLIPLFCSPSHVVNIGSMAGFQGSSKFPGLSYYSASKAALSALTESLAEEYKSRNIKFNCLAIGSVQTEMLSKAFPDYKAPLNPIEMSEYILDFAINGCRYYNGKVLPVALSTP